MVKHSSLPTAYPSGYLSGIHSRARLERPAWMEHTSLPAAYPSEQLPFTSGALL
jgi:hypothetical protein